MSLFNVFQVSSSAMTAQSMRLNATASNLANADSVISSDGKPYRAKQVVFEATPMGNAGEASKGVRVRQVVEDASPARSYQTNVEVMNTAKTMMLRTLQIGQG